jgi:hypothetical protein
MFKGAGKKPHVIPFKRLARENHNKARTHTCTYTYTYAHAYTYTCIHIYMHIHTHINTHTGQDGGLAQEASRAFGERRQEAKSQARGPGD